MATLQKKVFVLPEDSALIWDSWRSHIAPVFDSTLRPETNLRVPIAMTSIHLGQMIIGERVAPAESLERSAHTAVWQGVDHILLHFYRHGRSRVVTQTGSEEIGPGQFVICDLAQPIRIESAEPVSISTVLLPRSAMMNGNRAIEAFHGRVFDYTQDLPAELFFSYLQNLLAASGRLQACHLPTLSQAASNLCGSILLGREPVPRSANLKLGIAVRQFIGAELVSPELGVGMIIARFRLSRATLYRLFEADGGVRNYIRDRRLNRAMNLITGLDATGRQRISSIAYATGFSDDKTFSRAFKRRFGVSPRAVDAAGFRWPAANDDRYILSSWIRELAA